MAIQNSSTPPLEFRHEIAAVRLGLFDLGGVLYHANYFALLEETREAFLQASGMPYPSLAAANQHLAIAESHQKFLAPIIYGQPLQIVMTAEKVQQVGITLHYRIYSRAEEQKLLHHAWTRLVFVDAASGELKPARMPAALREAFLSIASETVERRQAN